MTEPVRLFFYRDRFEKKNLLSKLGRGRRCHRSRFGPFCRPCNDCRWRGEIKRFGEKKMNQNII